MNIVMLGHSNAGKTAYVTAMYGCMRAGVSGFQVRAERREVGAQLQRRASAIAAGHYPGASDRRSTYHLQLWHESARIMDFVWKDYRGGALTESSHSEQARQLQADMTSADGLVLTIDATELLRGARSQAYVRPLVSTAIRLLSQRSDHVPVVIALTKWDIVKSVDQQALAAAEQFVGALVQSLRQTDHLHGILVPVACGEAPRNVAIPVLWCLHIRLLAYVNQLDYEIRYLDEQRRIAMSRSGVIDSFLSWMNNEPTWTEIAARRAAQALQLRAGLEPLIAPARELSTLFNSLEQYGGPQS